MYGWAGSNVIKDECESLHKSSSNSWAYIYMYTRAVLYTCKYITIMVSCSMFGKKWKYQKHEFDFIIYLRVIKNTSKQLTIHNKLYMKSSWGYEVFWCSFKQTQDELQYLWIITEFSVWKLDGGSRPRITNFFKRLYF